MKKEGNFMSDRELMLLQKVQALEQQLALQQQQVHNANCAIAQQAVQAQAQAGAIATVAAV